MLNKTMAKFYKYRCKLGKVTDQQQNRPFLFCVCCTFPVIAHTWCYFVMSVFILNRHTDVGTATINTVEDVGNVSRQAKLQNLLHNTET